MPRRRCNTVLPNVGARVSRGLHLEKLRARVPTILSGLRYLHLAAGRSVNPSSVGVRPTSITQPPDESAENSGVRDHFAPSRTMSWRTVALSIAVHRDLPGSTRTRGILPGST